VFWCATEDYFVVFFNLLQGCIRWASTNLVMLDGGMRYESAQQIGDFYYSGWGNKHLSKLSFNVNRSGGSRGQVGHSPVLFYAIYLTKFLSEMEKERCVPLCGVRKPMSWVCP
jgi:hypothetical protein